MFFKYLAGEPSEAPPPRPVYARVDQTEPVDDADDDAPSLVLLDCIDAEWLDDNADRADHLSDPGFEEAGSLDFRHRDLVRQPRRGR